MTANKEQTIRIEGEPKLKAIPRLLITQTVASLREAAENLMSVSSYTKDTAYGKSLGRIGRDCTNRADKIEELLKLTQD